MTRPSKIILVVFITAIACGLFVLLASPFADPYGGVGSLTAFIGLILLSTPPVLSLALIFAGTLGARDPVRKPATRTPVNLFFAGAGAAALAGLGYFWVSVMGNFMENPL